MISSPTDFGPGSQPDPDGELQYMPMPSGMRTYSPHIPDAEDQAALVAVIAMLAEMAAAAEIVAQGARPVEFDLATLSPAARKVMSDALGQGEVSMKLRGHPAVMVQESVFAGVWMVLAAGLDKVEVAPVPTLALARAHIPHRPAIGALAKRINGLANAPAILSDLMDRSRTHAGGTHIINRSLLPHTTEDLTRLDEPLGEGAVTILSPGLDTLILDTF